MCGHVQLKDLRRHRPAPSRVESKSYSPARAWRDNSSWPTIHGPRHILDDIAISPAAAGTLAILAARGHTIRIATLTAGECGSAKTGIRDRHRAIRKAEAAAGNRGLIPGPSTAAPTCPTWGCSTTIRHAARSPS